VSYIEARTLSVVDSIYAAASDFALWSDALGGVADLLGAEDAALGTVGPDGIAWLEAPRTDPDYLRRYADYHAEDVIFHEIVAKGVGHAVTDDMVVDDAALASNAHHHEWALPQGYRTRLGGVVLEEDGWRTVVMLPGQDSFGAQQKRLFTLISSHLRRAMQINIRLAREANSGAVSIRLLEQMSTGAMLVDAGGRLLFANKAAETLFTPKGGLKLSGGRLSATETEDDALLAKLIGQCAAQRLGDCGGELRLRSASWKRRTLLVLPLRQSMPVLTSTSPVAMLFEVIEQSDEATIARLRLHYGLTPAEAAFAIEIAKGDGKRAAAERRGISYGTARTHLSNIFGKAGVNRQAELVRLIVGNDSQG
jgi:DNA-binding CsgD family transcriptional regulator/PAS domain-containing protein